MNAIPRSVGVRVIVAVGLLALQFAFGGCAPKVRPSAYQAALDDYYQALTASGGSPEGRLEAAIRSLDVSLRGNPADPDVLMLRADAHMELLRLSAERNKGALEDRLRQAFLSDLQLLEGRANHLGADAVRLLAHTANLAGDWAILGANSLPATDQGGCVEESCQVRRMLLYRIAGDMYAYAAATAAGTSSTPSTDDPLVSDRRLGLQRESEHARNGYAQALSGVAQGEIALGLSEHAIVSLGLASAALRRDGPFPPPWPPDYLPTPRQLSAGLHRTLALQESALGALRMADVDLPSLSKNALVVLLRHYEAATKGELAAALLSSPPQDLNGAGITNDDQMATLIRLWLAAEEESPSQ